MLNEPLFKVLIEVVTKCCQFVLWQIINGSKWRLCSFHKTNGVIIWSMLGQGVYNSLFKHILEFLILGRNFMWTWLNIWWRKNIYQKCISSCGNLHEGICSNKQRFRAPRPSCTIYVFLLLQIVHDSNKGFTFLGLVLWCFKMKTLCVPILSQIM